MPLRRRVQRAVRAPIPEEVLNATLKIGTRDAAPYPSPWDAKGPIRTAYIVEGEIIYGSAGAGYVAVRGVSDRKHGMRGALQHLFFFLPDAIDLTHPDGP